MRAIQTCDFCGEPAAGTFEIVSAALGPSEREQRRAVLCNACHDRLETLLEPLLDRLEDGGESGHDGNGRSSRDDTPPETDDVAVSIGGNDETRTADGSRSDGVEAAARASRQGVTTESNADIERESAEDGAEPDDRNTESALGDDSQPPAAYGKVLRLLRNRELPMDRADLEGLAAGAYDLESHEVDAIIDHALAKGKLAEDGDQLRRP
ncbi:hypothetical protein [Natronosalvus halobius]|uniref:hypothetical protein n=1 Tax=Natronosalvus halobius TaxID=2953746 RepID=UPI0020A06519|nr:hypothetical protein [Natronosalvus halobius]USZ70630.1 hypothetical protein NGM15_10990 [Natronosalvus halobius]